MWVSFCMFTVLVSGASIFCSPLGRIVLQLSSSLSALVIFISNSSGWTMSASFSLLTLFTLCCVLVLVGVSMA